MTDYTMVLYDLAVSHETAEYWGQADQAALESAARKLYLTGADPWVFSGDELMFRSLAGNREKAAFNMLTENEKVALFDW